jgi:hypothetical protein
MSSASRRKNLDLSTALNGPHDSTRPNTRDEYVGKHRRHRQSHKDEQSGERVIGH